MLVRFFLWLMRYTARDAFRKLIVDLIGGTLVAVLILAVLVASKELASHADAGKEAHDYLCYQKLVLIPDRITQYEKAIEDARAAQDELVLKIFTSALNREQGHLESLSLVDCKEL